METFVGRLAATITIGLLIVGCAGGAATATVSATASSTSAASAAAGPIAVELFDGRMSVSAATAPAGETTFQVRNGGEFPHDFVIISTELDAAELPVEQLKADESSLDVVDRVDQLGPGDTAELTVDLAPGHYVLICNVSGHYAVMNANLDVT